MNLLFTFPTLYDAIAFKCSPGASPTPRKPLCTPFRIKGLHILRQITQQKSTVQILFHLLPIHDPPAFFQQNLLIGSGVMVESGCLDQKRQNLMQQLFLLGKLVLENPQELLRRCTDHVDPVRLCSAQLRKVQVIHKKAISIRNNLPAQPILFLFLKHRLFSADFSVFQFCLLVVPGINPVAAAKADSSARKIIVRIHAPAAALHVLNQASLFLFQSPVFFRELINYRLVLCDYGKLSKADIQSNTASLMITFCLLRKNLPQRDILCCFFQRNPAFQDHIQKISVFPHGSSTS